MSAKSRRLAPLLDDLPVSNPSAQAWKQIERTVGIAHDKGDNVVMLRRRVTVWRAAAAGCGALAACLAVILAVEPRTIAPPPVRQTAPSPPLVAVVGSEEETKLVASWDSDGRRLVLAVAGSMPADERHSYELWVIPKAGKPHSLGLMPAGRRTHLTIEQALAELMRNGATIAVSLEPRGGSPSDAPTGAVVASGTLETA